MIARRFFLVAIGVIAASSSAANAFKPSARSITTSSKSAVVYPNVAASANDVVIRGGDSSDGLQKADVVKAHGIACFLFAATFFLDTLGGKLKKTSFSMRYLYLSQ